MPDAVTGLPIDPDVDLHAPGQRSELPRAPWTTLGAISAGGVVGALARYGTTTAFPRAPGQFPWAVFAINVSGCLLIGALMAVVAEAGRGHRLLRPFLGVGVLGGFTTFSTYVVDIQRAVTDGAARVGLAYLAATLAAALAAVFAGLRLTRLVAVPRTEEHAEPAGTGRGEGP